MLPKRRLRIRGQEQPKPTTLVVRPQVAPDLMNTEWFDGAAYVQLYETVISDNSVRMFLRSRGALVPDMYMVQFSSWVRNHTWFDLHSYDRNSIHLADGTYSGLPMVISFNRLKETNGSTLVIPVSPVHAARFMRRLPGFDPNG